VQFPPGETSVQVSGQVSERRIRRYVINASAGQVMTLDLPSVTGPVTLDVRFPSGEMIPDASRVLSWQGQLPEGGDYMVDVSAPRPSDYTLRISVN
jgi:serine/threonine-protein kinase